jgi:hypothetical protein
MFNLNKYFDFSVIITIAVMALTIISMVQMSSAIGEQNAIDCNSKKGTTNTLAGSLNYGGVKCEGQNGGTAFAGGLGSNSGSIGIHGIQGPNDNAHFAGNIKR